MAAETGNTYIFETMTDSIEISAANMGFTTIYIWTSWRARKSVDKWLQQRLTTGNRDMATKTGNTYIIFETMTDSVEIPTANSGFSMNSKYF